MLADLIARCLDRSSFPGRLSVKDSFDHGEPGFASRIAVNHDDRKDPGQVSHEQERIEAIKSHKGGHWLTSILINGLGATITFVVFLVIAVTKFTHGAWAVVIIITGLVLLFRGIHRHYLKSSRKLSLKRAATLLPLRHRVIVPVSGIHRGILPALRYALSICNTDVTAVYVEVNPQHTEAMRQEWNKWGMGIPLKVIESPYRSLIAVLLKYITDEADRNEDASLTVVLPEVVPHSWWQHFLYNQEALHIKGRLLFEPGIIVTSVPYHLSPNETCDGWRRAAVVRTYEEFIKS